jgi:hypothetical protein
MIKTREDVVERFQILDNKIKVLSAKREVLKGKLIKWSKKDGVFLTPRYRVVLTEFERETVQLSTLLEIFGRKTLGRYIKVSKGNRLTVCRRAK